MELNGAEQIEATALQFPQYAPLHSLPCVQVRLITVLGNCGCVAVASFLGVPSPLEGSVACETVNQSHLLNNKICATEAVLY
jgi:hypothetical protein